MPATDVRTKTSSGSERKKVMAYMKRLQRDYGDVIWTGKKCIMGMPISFTRYILTSSVLYTKVGFLNIKEDEIELY